MEILLTEHTEDKEEELFDPRHCWRRILSVISRSRGDISVGKNVGSLIFRLRRVQLVGLQSGYVVIVAEVSGGSGDSEVIASGKVNSVHGETGLPGSLICNIVADTQSVSFIPAVTIQ